jgi:hypothetical protein
MVDGEREIKKRINEEEEEKNVVPLIYQKGIKTTHLLCELLSSKIHQLT